MFHVVLVQTGCILHLNIEVKEQKGRNPLFGYIWSDFKLF